MNHHKDMIEISKKFKEGYLALGNKKVIENVYDPDIKKVADKLIGVPDGERKDDLVSWHNQVLREKRERMMALSDVVLEPASKRRRM